MVFEKMAWRCGSGGAVPPNQALHLTPAARRLFRVHLLAGRRVAFGIVPPT
jgi:hypothetical protein